MSPIVGEKGRECALKNTPETNADASPASGVTERLTGTRVRVVVLFRVGKSPESTGKEAPSAVGKVQAAGLRGHRAPLRSTPLWSGSAPTTNSCPS
jgi:hypothetical protein